MTGIMLRGNAAKGTKFGFAALAAFALVVGGVSPAIAAGTQIGPNDVAGFENGDESSPDYNYDQWHIGNTEDPDFSAEDSLEFGKCSVTVLAPVEGSVTQVLKGFPVNGRPSTVAELRALIESISIDISEGDVTLQIPVFLYPGPDEEPVFTTFRNVQSFTNPGTHTLGLDTLLVESSGGVELTVEQFLMVLEQFSQDGAVVEVLGVGFTGAAGSVVNLISFAGNTYSFGTGCSGEVPVTPPAPKAPVSVQTGL